MNTGCEKRDGYGMSIGFPVFIPGQRFRGSSAITRPGSSHCVAVKKNSLRFLWDRPSKLLRQEDTAGSRPVVRRCANLSGFGDPTCLLPEVWQGETREARMACRQPVLHEKICLLRWETMQGNDHSGRSNGNAPRLAYDQGAGEAVYAGAAPENRHSRSEGDRHRRDLNSKGTYLPNRSERSGKASSYLVRRDGPLRRKYGPFLSGPRTHEGQEDPSSSDGHVEGLREVGQEECSRGRHSLRQVPCHAASGRGDGYGQEKGIRKASRQGPIVHQRAEVHALVSQEESGSFWPSIASEASQSQQEAEYRLSSEGNLRPVVELRNGRLGASILRQLESVAKVAEAQTLRRVCRYDRETLGGHCCLLQIREQDRPRIRRRFKQQDQGDSTAGLRSTRRRLPSPQDPDMYAQGDLKP